MAQLSPKTRFWLLTSAALLVAALTFSLGQWQMSRAAQKQALMLAIEGQGNESMLNAVDLATFKNLQEAVHRRATFKGVWRADHTVFLDNRQMNGKTGLVVVTPLVLDSSGQVILVQRGWVMRNFEDRAKLPDIQTPSGTVTVHGRIAPPLPSYMSSRASIRRAYGRILVLLISAAKLACP